MKTPVTFCLLLALSLMGYSQKKSDISFLVSPGQEKLNNYITQTKGGKDFSPYETPAIKNTAQASRIHISQNEGWKSWILAEREIPEYYPGTTLINEVVNSQYVSGYDTFVDYRKVVYEYDEEQRPTKIEYYYTAEDKNWELTNYIVQEFDFRGEQIYYAAYYKNWSSNQMELNYGYKAEDEYNQDGILMTRTWFSYESDQWIPDYREEYILNENNVVVEIFYAWNDPITDEWQYDEWMILTLNDEQEWSEAVMHTTPVSMAKPIFLLGSGTEAGWDNTAALEMTYLGEGVFGIAAYLREDGDMIKFISQLGQWAPQWGYGGSGDEWSGTLAYRSTESDPDPTPVMITDLSPGEYMIFADTANLYYEIYPMEEWDIIKKKYSTNKEEIDWIPFMKATDLAWYDFEMLKPENMTIWYNATAWKEGESVMTNEEPIWIQEEKHVMTYNDIGFPLTEIYYYWTENKEGYWKPEYKYETTYDHLYNITYEGSEYWNEVEEVWETMYGFRVNFLHNTNGSINSYIVSYYNEWDKELMEVMKYEYFYGETHIADSESNTLLIYPNPARESVFVQLPALTGSAYLTLSSMDGSVIINKQVDKPVSDYRLKTHHLKPGVYILIVSTKEHTISTRLIIK